MLHQNQQYNYFISTLTKQLLFPIASEYRSWLLYYSLPCMKGILKEVYYQHYALLVGGIYLLLKESISVLDLSNAEKLLTHFVEMLDVYYGMYTCIKYH
jgi:hypothetical protein